MLQTFVTQKEMEVWKCSKSAGRRKGNIQRGQLFQLLIPVKGILYLWVSGHYI